MPAGIVLASIVAFATLRLFEPHYAGTSLLEANNQTFPRLGVAPTIQDLAKSEKDILFSPMVLEPVLANPKLRTAPSLSNPNYTEINLLKNLSVTEAGTKSRMKVCYEDTDPEAAAMVCNAVVDSYLRQRNVFDHQHTINMERKLEPEIQRWEHEVERRQMMVHKLSKDLSGFAMSNPATAGVAESNLLFLSQLRTQISDVQTRIAVLDAQAALDEPIAESQSDQDQSQLDAELANSAKKMKRKRALLAIELEVLNKKYDEERSQLERLEDSSAQLLFAKDELEIATDVLGKLRSRLAAIRSESRRVETVQLLAAATPPRQPLHSLPLKRAAAFSGVAFASPLMLGFLLGFRRDDNDIHD
ncbi:hypothetical protein RMSM_01924 [Rhodopirellula maiorica SM1]|uniref:Lipopolysaccharide biosynthesis protein n=2 Tax=Novipirellula TaxID=2795426 RepID=M5S0F8_9BACT|nr:hypothetical protein RMSM_01924 [Rhodopirellula maiorica SM1]